MNMILERTVQETPLLPGCDGIWNLNDRTEPGRSGAHRWLSYLALNVHHRATYALLNRAYCSGVNRR
jgi:hypothetical protein